MKKSAAGTVIAVAGVLVFANLLSYVDARMRIAEYREEAEKYERWAENPSERENFLQSSYAAKAERLKNMLSDGKITENEFARETEKAAAIRDFKLAESPMKYAYYWRKKCALFSKVCPAEIKRKTLISRKKWIKELENEGIRAEALIID